MEQAREIIWQNPITRFLYSMNIEGDSIFQLPLDTINAGGAVTDSLSLERQPNIYTLSPDGKRIFYDYYDASGGGRYVAIADLNGRKLMQQLSWAFYSISRWQQDDVLTSLAYYDDYIRFEFFDLDQVFEVPDQLSASSVSIPNLGNVVHMDWADDRTLVLSSEKGIYTAYLHSNLSGSATVNLLMEARCPAEGFMRFGIDRQHQKLLVQRFMPEETEINPGTKTSQYILMNLDGSDKEIIEIPGL